MTGNAHVALLRGINVGGRRPVAMAALRDALAARGFEDVRTYVQSGNVVLRSDGAPEAVARAVERAVEDCSGLTDVPVVVRSGDELAAVVEGNPFPDATATPKLLQVSFCAAAPDREVVADLEARDWGGDHVAFRGREVYAHLPDGVQRSRLAQALGDRGLGVTTTARNWNTVVKLLEMVRTTAP